jgi:hypothetical protein
VEGSKIDWTDQEQLKDVVSRLFALSKQYQEARNRAAAANVKLNIITAANMSTYRTAKSNLGHETARIMLLEEQDPDTLALYREFEEQTARYKGLEQLIETFRTRISLTQSIIKNMRENA